MNTWWQSLITLGAGVPIALLTAWVTVKFAIRRFRSEKWFERRLDAYTKVIEALHFMKHCTETEFGATERGIDLPEPVEDELANTYETGAADLRRLTDMGALLFSPEAVSVLTTVSKELEAANNEQTLFEHLDSKNAAIKKALSDLLPIAKSDLRA